MVKKATDVFSKIGSNKLLIGSLSLITLMALGIRLGLICIDPVIAPYGGMWSAIQEAARNLIEGNGCVAVNQGNHLAPYYKIGMGDVGLLTATYWISGEYNDIYLRVIQAVIDSVGCLLIFSLGRKLFNRRTGLIASLLYAIYLPIAYLSTWPLHDAMIPVMILASLYFFVKAVQTGAVKFYMLSAGIIGISCYFQPSAQLLPLFFGIGIIAYNFRKSEFRNNVLNAAKMTVIMMAVLGLVVSPCLVRNYQLSGTINMRPPGLWQGVWQGFGEFENPVGARLADLYGVQLAKETLGEDVEPWSKETDTFFRGKVINTIKEHPVWWLGILVKRIPRTIVNFSELGLNLHPLVETEYFTLSKYFYRGGGMGYREALNGLVDGIRDGTFWGIAGKNPYGTVYFGLIGLFAFLPALLGAVGVWVMRRRWRILVMVLMIPVYFSGLHAMILVASYKSIVPASIGYILLSAVALSYIYGRIRKESI